MRNLYMKLSESEKRALLRYRELIGATSQGEAIESLIEGGSINTVCIASLIEKQLRRIAANYHQFRKACSYTFLEFDSEAVNIIHDAIMRISIFTSNAISRVQIDGAKRTETRIRLADDAKEKLKKMKSTGGFKTYDALLRFMLSMNYDFVDEVQLEECLDVINEMGYVMNNIAYHYNLTKELEIDCLLNNFATYREAIALVLKIIGEPT